MSGGIAASRMTGGVFSDRTFFGNNLRHSRVISPGYFPPIPVDHRLLLPGIRLRELNDNMYGKQP